MKPLFWVGIILFFFSQNSLAGQIFQWKDEEGRMYFSDTPPTIIQKPEIKSISMRSKAITPKASKTKKSKSVKKTQKKSTKRTGQTI